MHTVGDGMNRHVGKHRHRHVRVQLRYGVHRPCKGDAEVAHGTGHIVAAQGLGVRWEEVAKHGLDIGPREAVVPCGHGRVGGEEGACGQLVAAPAAAEHLKRGERAVPFVEVESVDGDVQRVQRAYAAHAEQVLLSDAHQVVAAVQAVTELGVLGRVLVVTGVEEVHGDRTTTGAWKVR